MYNVQECLKLYLRALTLTISILSFKRNSIFHLNVEGTLQAIIHKRITEKGMARSDEVTSSHNAPWLRCRE